MAKIELTVKSTYVPSWGCFEGCRELLQNVRDAKVMHGAEVSVKYEKRSCKLVMISRGASIDSRALLLGHTTKLGRADAAGQYGEGLKLGLLALCRAGYGVYIHTGDEVWTPKIEASAAFGGEKLLCVYTRKVQTKNEVRIEVSGVTADLYAELKAAFLFLRDDAKVIETPHGNMLEGAEFAGKIFVKGIFVQSLPDLKNGYDLTNASVDRDRKMVDIWDAKSHCSLVLQHASRGNKVLQRALYESVVTNKVDGQYTYSAPAETVDALIEVFDAEHGEGCVPVATEEEAGKIRYLGGRAVVAPETLRRYLGERRGTAQENVQRLSQTPQKVYQPDELTAAETAVYERAHALLDPVLSSLSASHSNHGDLAGVRATVVDFRTDTEGRASLGDGTLSIAKKMLGSVKDALAVLVHEFAHLWSMAGDGTVAHTRAVEEIWSALYAALYDQASI